MYNDKLLDAIATALEELEKYLDDPIALEAFHALNELKGKHHRWWTEYHGTPHHLGRIPDDFID